MDTLRTNRGGTLKRKLRAKQHKKILRSGCYCRNPYLHVRFALDIQQACEDEKFQSIAIVQSGKGSISLVGTSTVLHLWGKKNAI
jgi:hypothetical protein